MDGTRFDLWTRRRVGVAAGGAAAVLLHLLEPDTAAAKKKKKKKKRCVNPGAACRSSRNARRCCAGLACDVTPGGSGRACCHRQRRTPCNSDFECCGGQVLCTDRLGDPTFLCRGILNASCAETTDCGGSLDCQDGTCML